MEAGCARTCTPSSSFGGVPALAVPDNTKTGVTKAHRYDPDLNPTYHNFAMHYGFGVVPARPYKPRDKAKVENAVQVAQRWIIAALRHRKFFSLEEPNQAIRELLDQLNHRPFRKRDGSRASVFEALDKPALKPLPGERFDMSQWSRARVNIDYHVAFDANLYSVPYNLVHEAGGDPLDADHGRDPAQRHARGFAPAQPRPRASRHQRRASPQESSGASGMDALAHGALGANDRPAHRAAVRADHGRQAAPGDGLSRSAWASSGWPRSTRRHAWKPPRSGHCSPARAATTASKSILKNSLDQQPLPSLAAAIVATATARQHPRRGVLRVRRANMLQEPMMEKLTGHAAARHGGCA